MITTRQTLLALIFTLSLIVGITSPALSSPAEPVIETVEQFAASDCWLYNELRPLSQGDLYVYAEKGCNIATSGTLRVSLFGPAGGNFLGSTQKSVGTGVGYAGFTRYCHSSGYQYLYTVSSKFTDSSGRSITRSTGHYRSVSC